ncbi:non-specific serine/threonine protein kinase [Trifolium repens]|nr:non-specific serine/threonine protein kinase [Trifolium repens]
MEGRKVNIIAATSVITLIIIIIIARVLLKLSNVFFLMCGAGVSVILAVIAFAFLSLRHKRRTRILESELKSESRELRIDYSFLRKVAGVPTKFRYKELEEATDGFQSLIGRGSSASVFKGILNDGTSVAVKRIDAEERGEREFKSEVAAIANVQHVNLVRLFGLMECGGVDEVEVYRLVYTALWCVQEKPRLRPSMARVVDMLEGRVKVEEPPTSSKMILVDFLSVDDDNVVTDSNNINMPRLDTMSSQGTQSNVECNSIYSFTTTVFSGR